MNDRYRTLFMGITFLLIFIMAARTPIDSDLWWHLRAGEETVRLKSPLTQDLFSQTRFGSSWNNHSWLSQTLMFGLFDTTGYLGLSLLMVVAAILSMYFVSLQMHTHAILDAILLLFGSFVASVNWVPRPQIFSLIFLSLTSYLLFLYQNGSRRIIWWLPVLFMVWGNFHGGYPLGLILIGCVIGGEIVEFILNGENKHNWKSTGNLILVGVLGYLLTAVNPNGIKNWLIPFQTVGVEGLQNLISEWASPDFHQPLQFLFLVLFFITIWVFVSSGKTKKIQDLIVVTIFGMMAFIARRNFGPFVIVTLPIISKHFDLRAVIKKIEDRWAFKSFFAKPTDTKIPPVLQKTINILLVGVLIFAGVVKLWAVNQSDFIDHYLENNYPVTALNWVEENLDHQAIFNEYNWGGFLIWNLRDFPVFIDGRTDLFGDEIINEWLNILNCGENWNADLMEKNIALMIVSPERPIVQCAMMERWEIPYRDSLAVVLVSSSSD